MHSLKRAKTQTNHSGMLPLSNMLEPTMGSEHSESDSEVESVSSLNRGAATATPTTVTCPDQQPDQYSQAMQQMQELVDRLSSGSTPSQFDRLLAGAHT